MNLYFLGTGAGLPSTERNVTSIALCLFQERGSIWLIDCGEGTQHQILRSPLRVSKIEKIFITHLHGDHIYGLPGLLGSRAFQSTDKPLSIYGPPGIRAFIETCIKTSETHLTYPLEIFEIEPGIVCQDDQFTVTCQLLKHRIASYGYRFDAHDIPGHLLKEKLDALGIQPGPLWKLLKAGQDIQLENGTILSSKEFVGPKQKGLSIVICGDTMPTPAVRQLALHADVLVHESTYRFAMQERAIKHHHSTTIDAAQAASEAQVKSLILTHISARYKDADGAELLQEAREIFPNTVLAFDHSSFHLPISF